MTVKFTICIPTFNRGPAALNQVLKTLELIPADWEILVLDNCSLKYREEYQRIDELAQTHPQVRYIRHEENREYHGNILACIQHANSPYLQIISDEDFSNPTVVGDVVRVLEEFPNVGLVRGSISASIGVEERNSYIYSDQFLSAGRNALTQLALNTNYISGIIYNKLLIASQGLLERLDYGLKFNPMIRPYAHMYLDILISSRCAVMTSKEIVCYEGEEYSLDVKSQADGAAYAFGGRLEQVLGFRDAYREVCASSQLNDLSLLADMYVRLVRKYFTLFNLSDFLHSSRSLDVKLLHDSLEIYFLAAANIPEFVQIREQMHDVIRACARNSRLTNQSELDS